MRINLEGRNSCCSTKITNDDGHHFVASRHYRYCVIVVVIYRPGSFFFLVVLRPVSHSPLENALFLLGTKTDLLLGQQHNCAATGSRDHKSFVALLFGGVEGTFIKCMDGVEGLKPASFTFKS